MTARRRALLDRWGVRGRSTAAAALLILLVVAVAGAVLLEVLGRAVLASAHDQAVARQTEVLRELGVPWGPGSARGTAGETAVYTRSGLGELVLRLGRPGVIVQLRDAEGQVVAASPATALGSELSVPALEPGQSFDSARTGEGPAPRSADFVYVAHGMHINDVPFTLTVAVPMALQQGTIRTVTLFLLVGGPVLALLGAALMWFLVGRSLAPVRRITGQVRGIGTGNLGERVDVPPHPGRDRGARRHDERDARPPGGLRPRAAAVRRGRLPRAAQPARHPDHHDRGRGRRPVRDDVARGRPRAPVTVPPHGPARRLPDPRHGRLRARAGHQPGDRRRARGHDRRGGGPRGHCRFVARLTREVGDTGD